MQTHPLIGETVAIYRFGQVVDEAPSYFRVQDVVGETLLLQPLTEGFEPQGTEGYEPQGPNFWVSFSYIGRVYCVNVTA